jgi:alpha-beta hydrolase superfamily lysophospholipase
VTQRTEWELHGCRERIVVSEWRGDDPRFIALIAHGYGEHIGRYDHVARRLCETGAIVCGPDFQGHGKSDGERVLIEDVDDLVAALDAVARQARSTHGDLPLAVIGHSMGGIVATLYAQRNDDIDALVLSGPVIGGNPGFEALLEMNPIPEIPIDPHALSRDPAVGRDYAEDPLVWHGAFKRPTLESLFQAIDAIAQGPSLGSLPTLWVHGEEDALAPLERTRPAIERVRGEHVVERIYSGAQHEVFNETNRDEVIADVIAFLDEVLMRARVTESPASTEAGHPASSESRR